MRVLEFGDLYWGIVPYLGKLLWVGLAYGFRV